ncbi:MAG: 4-(cytidine 5'-diphospho)-2-C-methyl-D-erythritol kinase [Planctomycetes bacterium]|nr:4-(cytidine 5'-diphospho)-2-C-methyl-D-erythritol kinase [Planctomycetota bacterium]MBU2596355.1 4-(cytidine 5'-diphospho)-2-C-methyl-D-erythritol kinase [Planctomycetota bacterium]
MKEKYLKPQFEMSGEALVARAPAKINLSLLVADKRPDGYHNIETLMAKVTLYDELIFEEGKEEGIELLCNGHWSPAGRDNLVYKACRLFYDAINTEPRIKLTLTKNIPAGAGLGGASSDAATVLLALNKLHNQSLNSKELHKLAGQIGSDVPFFLDGPLALCSGRGEKVGRIDKTFPFTAILVLADINVSTKRVYESFRVDLELFNSLHEQIKSCISKSRIDLIQKMCANMLAKTSFALNNELTLLKVKIKEITKLPVSLSGSGSALFMILDGGRYREAEILQREIGSSRGCNSVIVFDNEW